MAVWLGGNNVCERKDKKKRQYYENDMHFKCTYDFWFLQECWFIIFVFMNLVKIFEINAKNLNCTVLNINQRIAIIWKKKKTLCNTLNWGNWNSGFIKLGVRWAERDI